jgi:hypothetical protein
LQPMVISRLPGMCSAMTDSGGEVLHRSAPL